MASHLGLAAASPWPPDAARWFASQAANPDPVRYGLRVAETVRHRHEQLQHLGRRLKPKPRRRSPQPYSQLVGEDGAAREPLPPSPSVPAASTPKPGRNDPCPCGSGKKFKKCCGAG